MRVFIFFLPRCDVAFFIFGKSSDAVEWSCFFLIHWIKWQMPHMKMQWGGARETNDYIFLALTHFILNLMFSQKFAICNYTPIIKIRTSNHCSHCVFLLYYYCNRPHTFIIVWCNPIVLHGQVKSEHNKIVLYCILHIMIFLRYIWLLIRTCLHFYMLVERWDVLWYGPVRPFTIACERDNLKTACQIDFTFWYDLNTTKTSDAIDYGHSMKTKMAATAVWRLALYPIQEISCERDILKTACQIDFTFWYGLNTP